jgi:hypothetical protein
MHKTIPNGLCEPFDPANASLEDWGSYLITFDSATRTKKMVYAMNQARTSELRLRIFLDTANCCDAPWLWRHDIAQMLREACRDVELADCLGPKERAFYDDLPPIIPIWRGCENGRERGISWTTDRAIAERFSRGMRCINKLPTLASAEIPKEHLFGVFLDRAETELAVDYRRLLKVVKAAPLACAAHVAEHL